MTETEKTKFSLTLDTKKKLQAISVELGHQNLSETAEYLLRKAIAEEHELSFAKEYRQVIREELAKARRETEEDVFYAVKQANDEASLQTNAYLVQTMKYLIAILIAQSKTLSDEDFDESDVYNKLVAAANEVSINE